MSKKINILIICGLLCAASLNIQAVQINAANETMPIASFEAPTLICTNTEVRFVNSSTNAIAYHWDFGDDKTSDCENPTHKYTEAGEYIVTLTVTGDNPEDKDIVTKIVEAFQTPQDPTVSGFVDGGLNFCENIDHSTYVLLANNGSFNDNFSIYWFDDPDGDPIIDQYNNPNLPFFVVQQDGSSLVLEPGSPDVPATYQPFMYYAQAISADGCKSALVEVPLIIYPMPVISVTPHEYCENTTDRTYTLSVEACENTNNIDWWGNLQILSVYDSETIVVQVPGASAVVTPETPDEPEYQPFIYYVRAMSPNGCVSEQVPVPLTIFPLPELNALLEIEEKTNDGGYIYVPLKPEHCSPLKLRVTNTLLQSEFVEYKFQFASQLSFVDMPSNIIDYRYERNEILGEITLRMTGFSTVTKCSNEISQTFIILPSPDNPTANPHEYCEDAQNPRYQISVDANTTNIRWFNSEGDIVQGNQTTIDVLQSGSSSIATLETSDEPATYEPFMFYAQAVDANGCTSELVPVPLTIFPLPELEMVFEAQLSDGSFVEQTEGCSPFELWARNTSPSKFVEYEWQWEPNLPFVDAPLFDPEDPATRKMHVYNVAGTQPEFVRPHIKGVSTVYPYCTATKPQGITILPGGVVADFIAYGAIEGCSQLTVNFTASGVSQSAYNHRYYWNLDEPPQFNDPQFGTDNPNPMHTFHHNGDTSEPQIYKVWLQADNGLCFDNKSMEITVYPAPQASFEHNLANGSICPPEPVVFTNTSNAETNGENTLYLWDFGDGFLSYEKSTEHVYNNWTSSTPVQRTVTLTASNNFLSAENEQIVCSSPYSRDIIVNPQLEARFTPPSNDCAPYNAQFYDQSSGSVASYNWDFGDDAQSDSVNPSHTFNDSNETRNSPMDYAVQLTVSNAWCSDAVTHILTIYPQPVASFTVDHAQGCQPLEVTFTNTSNDTYLPNPDDEMIYTFDFGDGNIASHNSTEPVSHIFTNSLGVELLRNPVLTAKNQWGCESLPFTEQISILPFVKADFQMEPVGNTHCSPFTVRFLNSSIGLDGFEFDFGDGVTFSGDRHTNVLVPHTFYAPNQWEDATFTVSLTAMSGDCQDVFTQEVTVLSSPEADFRIGNNTFSFPAPPIQIENLTVDSHNFDYLWSWSNSVLDYVHIFSNSPNPPPLTISTFGDFALTQKVTAPNRVCESSLTLPFSIIPSDRITDIYVSPNVVTVQKKTSQQFMALERSQAGIRLANVTWSVSGNELMATQINSDGLLYISDEEVAPTLIVTATSVIDNRIIGEAMVAVVDETVTPAVLSVEIIPNDINLPKGAVHQFTAIVSAQGGASTDVLWEVHDRNWVATKIIDTGLLTIADSESVEKFTVTATSDFDKTKIGTATVWVDAPVILDTGLPNGRVDVEYSAKLDVLSELPVTWTIVDALPDNLTLDENTGEISGTAVNAGAFTFTVKATNERGIDTKEFSIIIDRGVGATLSAVPTRHSVTTNSVTVNPVSAPSNGQSVEYAIVQNIPNASHISVWQNGTTFTSLSSNSLYYVFARAAKNDNFYAGDVVVSTHLVTNFATSSGVAEHVKSLNAWIRDGCLHVEGLTAGEMLSVYGINGALLYRRYATGNSAVVALPASGVYIVHTEQKSLKIVFEQ